MTQKFVLLLSNLPTKSVGSRNQPKSVFVPSTKIFWKASLQADKRKMIYNNGSCKSLVIVTSRLLYFARGRFRFSGYSRTLPEQASSSSRTLDKQLTSSSRALPTQHGNKVVNQNVWIRPVQYDGVNLLYIISKNKEIYNRHEFEIIVSFMRYANIIFKPGFKKYIYL